MGPFLYCTRFIHSGIFVHSLSPETNTTKHHVTKFIKCEMITLVQVHYHNQRLVAKKRIHHKILLKFCYLNFNTCMCIHKRSTHTQNPTDYRICNMSPSNYYYWILTSVYLKCDLVYLEYWRDKIFYHTLWVSSPWNEPHPMYVQ